MIISYRYINLVLIGFGIVGLINNSIKLHNSYKKKTEIINRLKVIKINLQDNLAKCQKISEIRYRKPSYDKDILYKTNKEIDNEYFKIKDSIRVLQEMYFPYLTHTSTVLTNYVLARDILNKEIYIIYGEEYLIPCKAQSIFINNKLIDKYQHKVRIAKNTTTTIKHHKYQLGKLGIDTTETTREINLLFTSSKHCTLDTAK